MTRLSRLIGVLGAHELGRRLGRTAGTVRRWAREQEVPKAAQADLRAVDERRARARAAAKARREQEEKRTRAKREKERVAEERRREAARAKERESKRRELEAKRAAEKRRAEEKKQKERERQEKREAERKRVEEIARRQRAEREKAQREEKARLAAEAKRKAEEEAKRKLEEKQKQKEAERKKEAAKREAEKSEEVERRRKVLEEACRLLTSNRSIAEAIRVDEATIRRWMKGAPEKSPAFDRLEQLVVSIHTLADLMKQSGVVEKLPVVRSGHGRRSGRKTEGVYWTKAFMSFLSPTLIDEITKWVENHPGNYPVWMAVAMTSQYALGSDIEFAGLGPKEQKRDYKTVYVQLGSKSRQEWGNFAAERPEPTGQRDSAKAAAADMRNRLKQRLESGAVQVFVHGVTLFAYRRRTKEEESRWETAQRKERRKQWEQKTKSKKRKPKS